MLKGLCCNTNVVKWCWGEIEYFFDTNEQRVYYYIKGATDRRLA